MLIETPRAAGRSRLLVYGHYDVQPPRPTSAWSSDPFAATVRDGRIHGRGTADNKAQHLPHLFALESWLCINGDVPCAVAVLLDGEEEIGSPNLAGLVRDHRNRLACDLVVWIDGPVHDGGKSTVNFGVRGVVLFELLARGAARDLHSGNWGRGRAQPGVDSGARAGDDAQPRRRAHRTGTGR